MGAQLSTAKEKLGLSSKTEKQTLPCLKCNQGEWKFIGSDGKQYRHYCTNCKKEDKFDQIYGMD